MHHVGIEVCDLQWSIQFYERWFGLKVEQILDIEGEKIAFLQTGQSRLELVENPMRSSSSFIHIAFQVDDLEKLLTKMKEEKIEVVEPLKELDNGWKHAFIYGPDQEWVELMEIS